MHSEYLVFNLKLFLVDEIKRIYRDAVDQAETHKMVLYQFQTNLAHLARSADVEKQEMYARCRKKIKGVDICLDRHIQLVTGYGANYMRYLPEKKDMVFDIMVVFAREIWKQPALLHHRVSKTKKKENAGVIGIIAQESIDMVLSSMEPLARELDEPVFNGSKKHTRAGVITGSGSRSRSGSRSGSLSGSRSGSGCEICEICRGRCTQDSDDEDVVSENLDESENNIDNRIVDSMTFDE